MSKSIRINTICKELSKTGIFADVGCDHGYCSEYMLKNKLCDLAIITDISFESLQKAKLLLDDYIKQGKCYAKCCDGLNGIGYTPDQVLIAGMGGQEIIKILSESCIPQSFVFQPMKNQTELRKYLVSNGCAITKDYTFFDGKYYDIIVGSKVGIRRAYTEIDFEFGYDNIQNPSPDFIGKVDLLIKNQEEYLNRTMNEFSFAEVEGKLKKLLGVKNGNSK